MRNTNDKAPVKCRKSITINADTQKVWSVITDINNWSAWQMDISKAKMKGDLKPDSTFEWKTGGAKIHSTLHTVEPFSKFGWTGKALGTFAIHNWTILAKEGKAEVTADESMEGFPVRLFRNSFNRNLEKGMQSWLELLKKECEK